MKLVVRARDGKLELNWMFLPTFLGMSSITKTQVEQMLEKRFDGRTINETLAREMHNAVVDFLCEKNPIPGLRKYLLAIEHIEEPS